MSKIHKHWSIIENGQQDQTASHCEFGEFSIYQHTAGDTVAFQELTYEFTFAIKEEMDLFTLFASIQSIEKFDLLIQEPRKVVDLIIQYENKLRIREQPLFIDIKKEFVIPMKVDFVCDSPVKRLTLLGFSIFDKEIEFQIKAFDYQGIRTVFESLIDIFKSEDLLEKVESKENIKWIRQKQLRVNTRESPDYKNSDKLLDLSVRNSEVFSEMFLFLIKNGYIDKKIRTYLKDELSTSDYNKTLKLFGKSLLLTVESNKISIMHTLEPMNISEDDEKTIYTLNPRLWQYFINHWHEEFIGKVLGEIAQGHSGDVRVVDYCAGYEFNFQETARSDDNVEIDWLVLIEKDNVYKLIAIECKRKMSKKIKKGIKEKYENKILNSGFNYNLIDAYINVGYFSEKDAVDEEKIGLKGRTTLFPFITFSEKTFDQNILRFRECFDKIFEE